MSSDGTVSLVVNGTTYTYGMDAAKHYHVNELMHFTPGRALNYIKRNANWTKKENKMEPTATAVQTEENAPFINVYEPIGGWKSCLWVWDPDMMGPGEGGYDVWQTGMWHCKTKDEAIIQAWDWCLAEDIAYKGPEPENQTTIDTTLLVMMDRRYRGWKTPVLHEREHVGYVVRA